MLTARLDRAREAKAGDAAVTQRLQETLEALRREDDVWRWDGGGRCQELVVMMM